MELNEFKAQNFWLRVIVVTLILGWLMSIAVMNRGVIQERKTLNDSLTYYKKLSQTLPIEVDSLQQANEIMIDQIGKRDMIIEEAKMASPNMMKQILNNTEGLVSYEK